MIHEEKVKTMAQLALYEKKKGRKDFRIYSYEQRDYVRFEGLKTAVLVTIAFVLIAGLYVLGNMESLIASFDVLNYKMIIAVVVAAYLFLLIFYLVISHRKSEEEYNQVKPRVRRYARGLTKIEKFYAEEDKQQRKFEKGQWRNGQ